MVTRFKDFFPTGAALHLVFVAQGHHPHNLHYVYEINVLGKSKNKTDGRKRSFTSIRQYSTLLFLLRILAELPPPRWSETQDVDLRVEHFGVKSRL